MKLNTDKMIAETGDGIGWMIFNNPDRRNALSLEMWEVIDAILDAFQRDDAVRVVVMKGAGDKAFVSGADISQFEDQRKNAEQAERWGLVNRVVSEAALEEETLAYAARLANGPTVAFRYMKENLNRAVGGDMIECLDLEATHNVHTGFTEDHRKAVRAVMEKKTPECKGR